MNRVGQQRQTSANDSEASQGERACSAAIHGAVSADDALRHVRTPLRERSNINSRSEHRRESVAGQAAAARRVARLDIAY